MSGHTTQLQNLIDLATRGNDSAWEAALRLVAQSILLREPGQAADSTRRNEQSLQMLRWAEPLERPFLIGRSTQWLNDSPDPKQPGKPVTSGALAFPENYVAAAGDQPAPAQRKN